MNFSGLIVLARIEEDNTQRAYFRVRPLLTEKGIVSEEEIQEYQDEGYLRVVPDKNEQHTFKDRMRSLGEFCILNLTNMKPEFSKIRTNKNYNPQKGERNRYIVYSDAVQAVPNGYFYDVVSADEAAGAITPLVFIRNGAFITGPSKKDSLEPVGEQIQIQPDSAFLHTIVAKDETERLICWPVQSTDALEANAEQKKEDKPTVNEKPAAESAPQEIPDEKTNEEAADNTVKTQEEVPVAEKTEEEQPEQSAEKKIEAIDKIRDLNAGTVPSVNLLKEQKEEKTEFIPPVHRDQKLNGTPLYQPGIRQAVPMRNRNMLSETVERQRYVAGGRYESTGAEIADPAKLRRIDNPVENLSAALENAWQMTDTRERIADTVLKNPALKQMISNRLGNTEGDLKTSAVKEQLQEMEAERLMQLMRLDDLRREKDRLFEEALSERKKALDEKLSDSNEKLKALSAQIAEMTKDADRLRNERDEMIKLLDAPEGNGNHLYRVAGENTDMEILTERVCRAMTKSGFECSKNTAVTALILKLICGSMTIKARNYDDAVYGANAFLNAIGASKVNTDRQYAVITSGGNSFMATYGKDPLMNNADHIYAAGEEDETVLPVLALKQDMEALPEKAEEGLPVNEAALLSEILKNEKELPEPALNWIKQLRKAVGENLALCDLINMKKFIAIAQNYLSGGLPEAMDQAVQCFILPLMKEKDADMEQLRSLVSGLTGSVRMLGCK